MDGAEGQAWLKPDELGGRVRRISPEADDYGKTPTMCNSSGGLTN